MTYATVLNVDNSDLTLRPGMTATAEITVHRIADALLIPNAALRFSPPVDERTRSKPSGNLIQKLLPRPPRRDRSQRPARKDHQKRNRVWTLRGGQLTPVSITIGATDGTRTVITGGGARTRRLGGRGAGQGGPMTAKPLIRLHRVTKRYGHGHATMLALRGIDLDIMAGEFVAVMGPSGSGKSTCMNILGCLDTPHRRHFLFSGRGRRQTDCRPTHLAAPPLPGLRVSGLQPAQPDLGPGKCGTAPGLSRPCGRPAASAGTYRLGGRGADRLGEPHAGGTFRRAATTRGHCPGAGDGSQGHPGRRTHGQP